MYCSWYSNTVGRYNPKEGWLGLDYRNLFFDPLQARLTHIHELTHGCLNLTTDFGQATRVVLNLLPTMRHISEDEARTVEKALYESQFFLQEATATLIEILHLKREIGKQRAKAWAKTNLHQDYYARLEELFFVLDMSERYADEFTKKIPNLSLHTGIRRKVVELDLLRSPSKLIEYLKDSQNNPDARFRKLIEVIKYRPFLPTRPVEEICQTTGVCLFSDTSKQDAATFLNYVHSFMENPPTFTPDQIGDMPELQDTIAEINKNTIVANMNFNLTVNAEVLWQVDDLLHYKDQIETLIVSRLGDDRSESWDYMEQMLGRKFEAGIVAFLKTGEKYIFSMDFEGAVTLLNSQFKEKTLITKWGLFQPGRPEIFYFNGARKPDVVLCNVVQNLKEIFEQYFADGKKAEYLFVGTTENHPFMTLIIKDESNVLYLVNTVGNKEVSEFLDKHRPNLVNPGTDHFLSDTKHYNNTFSVWMGMPWEIDWYKTMLSGKEVIHRAS